MYLTTCSNMPAMYTELQCQICSQTKATQATPKNKCFLQQLIFGKNLPIHFKERSAFTLSKTIKYSSLSDQYPKSQIANHFNIELQLAYLRFKTCTLSRITTLSELKQTEITLIFDRNCGCGEQNL